MFLGFKNLRVFLYSFGSHMSSFAIAIFLLIISKLVLPAYKQIISFVAIVFMAISFYFTYWTLAPITDYSRRTYEIAIIILSFISVFVVYKIVSINKKLKSDYIKHHEDNNDFIKLANNFIDEFKSKYDKVG